MHDNSGLGLCLLLNKQLLKEIYLILSYAVKCSWQYILLWSIHHFVRAEDNSPHHSMFQPTCDYISRALTFLNNLSVLHDELLLLQIIKRANVLDMHGWQKASVPNGIALSLTMRGATVTAVGRSPQWLWKHLLGLQVDVCPGPKLKLSQLLRKAVPHWQNFNCKAEPLTMGRTFVVRAKASWPTERLVSSGSAE